MNTRARLSHHVIINWTGSFSICLDRLPDAGTPDSKMTFESSRRRVFDLATVHSNDLESERLVYLAVIARLSECERQKK